MVWSSVPPMTIGRTGLSPLKAFHSEMVSCCTGSAAISATCLPKSLRMSRSLSLPVSTGGRDSPHCLAFDRMSEARLHHISGVFFLIFAAFALTKVF